MRDARPCVVLTVVLESNLESDPDPAIARELVADRLWQLGAVAVVEHGDRIEASFASLEAEGAAQVAVPGHLACTRLRTVRTEDDDAALDGWRIHATDVHVAGFVLRPAWLHAAEVPLDAANDVIVIEPGRAFGIGGHPTTRACIEALVASADDVSGKAVLDVGTGTGVLAIVARRLGAARVVGTDHDRHAIEVARANVATNLARHGTVPTPTGSASGAPKEPPAVEVQHGSIPSGTKGRPPFALTVANLGGLQAPVALFDEFATATADTIVIGGVLDPDEGGPDPAPLDRAAEAASFALDRVWRLEGWQARRYRKADFSGVSARSREFRATLRPSVSPSNTRNKETPAG